MLTHLTKYTPDVEVLHVTQKACNASVAGNTLSIQMNNLKWLLSYRKCLYLLAKV